MKINIKADIREAVELYFTTTALGNAEIQRLFNCSTSKAKGLKDIAREQEVKDGVIQPSPNTVNTVSAYKAWGLDIRDLKKRLVEHQRLIKEGIL